MARPPRLRDSKRLKTHAPYDLNVFPKNLINKIGENLVYLLNIGRTDITGDDWEEIFADSIGGESTNTPLGLGDVVLGDNCWSVKTVKHKKPFECEKLRVISGRCSPDYSYGITDPHKDIQKTGDAVLSIWNSRVDIVNSNYGNVRVIFLVRSPDLLSYCLFEEELQRYRITDYTWKQNKNGNFIGIDKDGKTCFTWQPHGAQFTVHKEVPKNAIKFSVKKPPTLSKDIVLKGINFDESWITIHKKDST